MNNDRASACVDRRGLFRASGLLAAGAVAGLPAAPASAAGNGVIKAEEFWTDKGTDNGDVKLYIYRKRLVDDGNEAKPVLFLVHGSTPSSRGSFDLQVPGREYSLMDHMAGRGWDVWTMDHEG